MIDSTDASYLPDLAKCYTALGRSAEAEECYGGLLNLDRDEANDGDEADYESEGWKPLMYQGQGSNEVILSSEDVTSDTDSVRSEESGVRKTTARLGAHDQGDTAELSKNSMLAPRPAAKRARTSTEKRRPEKEDLQYLYSQRQSLAGSSNLTEQYEKDQWMSLTRKLIESFMKEKAFFSEQRHHEFLGYTREARHLANRKAREKAASVTQSEKGRQMPWTFEPRLLTPVLQTKIMDKLLSPTTLRALILKLGSISSFNTASCLPRPVTLKRLIRL